MADKVIGIKFGVAGGGSISGESGQLIKSQLEQIAKAVNLQVKVNINKTHFKKQINDLKSQLSEALGNLNVNIGTPGGRKAGAPGGGNAGSNASNTEKLDFNTLKSSLDKLYKIKQQAETALKKGQVNTAAELANTADGLDASYNQQLMKARELGVINDEQFKQLIEQEQALIRMHTARTKDAEAIARQREEQEKLAQAQKAAKTVEGQQSAWNGLYANAERLLQREDYLIQNNKKAAESAEKLRKAMAAGFDPTKPEQSAQNVKNLRTALKEVDAELAKIGTEADTFGFKVKKAFKTKVVQNLAYALLAFVGNAFRQVYQNVLDLDKAVTDLQIATGYTREETGKLVTEYAKLAQQLGATVTEVTAAADTWLRQGYEVAETTTLITNTLMLAKLGQLESAEAAKALTSAMKGYNVEVENSVDIVDKFTAVDMAAAVSAGDIATAMAETAVSANTAGVSMDRLIGYIATVAEVTQDGAESVGTFYKTMFARMSNIKAGRFVDDETGESLNDVASVLSEVGIALFDAEGQFKSFEDVLDEVGQKWEHLDSVQQAAIATAMAGTRQQEKFKVLMENYGKAMDLSNVSEASSGTATSKYEDAYMDSIDAKINALKAAWQEFSASLLDSDIVKLLVEIITAIANVLDAIISFGDGAVPKIAIVTGAVLALKAAISSLQKTLGNDFKTAWTKFLTLIKNGASKVGTALTTMVSNPYTWIIAMISVFVLFGDQFNEVGLVIIAAAMAIAVGVGIALNLLNAKVHAFMASNPLGWILAAITAIVVAVTSLIKAIVKWANADEEAFKEAKKRAEEKKKMAEEAAAESKELNELTNEYIELIGNKDSFLDLDEEARERILELQTEINTAVSDEYKGMDLVNGSLQEHLGYLEEIAAEKERQALDAAKENYQAQDNAYTSAFDSSGHFIPTKRIDNIGGIGSDLGSNDNIVFERGDDAAAHADDIATIFRSKSTIFGDADANIGDKKWQLGIEKHSDLRVVAKEWKEALDEVKAKGYIVTSDDQRLYNQLYAYYAEEILPLITNVDNAAIEVANTALPVIARTISKEVNPSDNIELFEDKMLEALKSELDADKNGVNDYGLDDSELAAFVESYLLGNYYDVYQKNSATTVKYSFETILGAVQEGYDTLRNAMDEMSDLGIISGDTMGDILENYPDLQEYFELTADGYKLVDGAMDAFISKYKEIYGLGENEDTWNAVIATLTASDEIEEWIEAQESIKEAYEDQLESQKKLIDIRKDLLKTYKEEVKYQKELKEKQEAVASLRTKLALAQMDTSAAGKARVRELAVELEEAETELDDFTLEHAIDVLTEQIESGYSEYESFIQKQVDRIEKAIEDAATYYKGGNIVEVPEHHTGGIVGGVELQSNEEFAKLLKGEYVSTPAQMQKFMRKTLPNIANYNNGAVNYNAPLIAIKCDSITEDSIPEIEKVVNEAVNKIKREIDSAFSRTGYRKDIK